MVHLNSLFQSKTFNLASLGAALIVSVASSLAMANAPVQFEGALDLTRLYGGVDLGLKYVTVQFTPADENQTASDLRLVQGRGYDSDVESCLSSVSVPVGTLEVYTSKQQAFGNRERVLPGSLIRIPLYAQVSRLENGSACTVTARDLAGTQAAVLWAPRINTEFQFPGRGPQGYPDVSVFLNLPIGTMATELTLVASADGQSVSVANPGAAMLKAVQTLRNIPVSFNVQASTNPRGTTLGLANRITTLTR